MAGKTIKVKAYKKYRFEKKKKKTRDYLMFNFKYPEFSIGLAFDGYFIS